MRQIKAIIGTLLVSGLTFVLFFVGLSFMLAVFFLMILTSLFVRPSTRQQWRKRWSQNWQQRHETFHRTRGDSPRRENRVIEGEYIVTSH